MCIKLADDEFATVQALMRMAVTAVIATALDIDQSRVTPERRLADDLGMDSAARLRLQRLIEEIFEVPAPRLGPACRVGDILDRLVDLEMSTAEPPAARAVS